MLNELLLKTRFYKESSDPEKDGDRWILTAGGLVLAIIIYHKFCDFSKFEVIFTEYFPGSTPTLYPSEFKYKDSLEEAKEAIRARLTGE